MRDLCVQCEKRFALLGTMYCTYHLPFSESKNVISIDPETGMPKLPNEYVWRVKDIGGEYLRVELCRVNSKVRTNLFGGVKVKNTLEVLYWGAVRKINATKEAILENAVGTLKRGYNPWEDSIPDVVNLIGIYPPKSLDTDKKVE